MPYWIPVPNGVFMVTMRLYNILATNKAGVSTILNPYNGIRNTSSPQ
jgi:hypothetical protein